ncbi:hypothetical protein PSU4_39750 [Pseudonocardia sulfidoxydans NBRC 16205]|uniref:Lsr2 family protein n=1 Tax=Pseudonocardia sulfidoxydans NBRC 16205 TaxID=1223511 RepID=A0A511DJP8_9PSEU|nr:Lsr2 family protein [Pseudonocardia sulfidoxydans]GEL25021.1 hypothetical protein PSU4_39750 [Pseudonocardia sulfidoxydans NBRC 16205]
MVTIRAVRLVDDLDGSEAVETVELGLDGRAFEIDLNAAHAAELRRKLAPYIASARRVRRDTRPRPGAGTVHSRREAAEMREWARLNGMEVADRGRVPTSVHVAYANRQGPAEPTPRSLHSRSHDSGSEARRSRTRPMEPNA